MISRLLSNAAMTMIKDALIAARIYAVSKLFGAAFSAIKEERESDPGWDRFQRVLPTLSYIQRDYPGRDSDISELETEYSDVVAVHNAALAGSESYKGRFNRFSGLLESFDRKRQDWQAARDRQESEPSLSHKFQKYASGAKIALIVPRLLWSYRSAQKMYGISRAYEPAAAPVIPPPA